MASTTFLFCGPCENRKSHRQAIVWCAICMEGLCKECEELHRISKLSKDHSVFDESIYPLLKPFLKDLKTDCDKHKKKFDFYCKPHSDLCCLNCVTDEHRQCDDLKPVDDESQGPRIAADYTNLERDLIILLQRIEEVKSNRTNNIKHLDEQKKFIQAEIKEIRSYINGHLDKLEKVVLEELSVAEERHSLDIAQILFEIDTRKQVLLDLQKIASCVQQMSSIHTILATHKVKELYLTEKSIIEKLLDEKGKEEVQLNFQINDKIKSLTANLKTFGKVDTSETVEAKQAVIEEKRSSTKSVSSRIFSTTDPNRISLKLVKKIKTSKRKSKVPVDIRGSVIMSDGRMLFADWSDNKKLMMFNVDGTHNRDIGVTGKPYDIARLDGERIAVSFPEDYVVQIFDVISEGYPIYQNIKISDQCWGIFYNNEKLFVGCNGHKIQIMNLSGHVLKTVPAKVNTVYCVEADSDYVYYSDEINNTVYCSDFDGNEMWKFRDPSLKYPCSVSYNPDGYVFVVGNISQNVMVTSSDGQLSRSLLGKLDGLDGPAGIHYDRQTNRLVVVLASFKGSAALYDVVYKSAVNL